MATIYAYSDGSLGAQTTLWDGVHDADEAKNAYFNQEGATAVTHRDDAVWAGMNNAAIFRTFMSFDTSGITVSPTEATLKVYGKANGDNNIIVVKSTYDPSNAGAASFNDLTGWGSGYNNSTMTAYSSEISSWSTSGYNEIALNSTAGADMASLDTFKIAIIDYDYDYLDVEPGTSVQVKTGMYFSGQSGTDKDPYIEYTAGADPSKGKLEFKSGKLQLTSGKITF